MASLIVQFVAVVLLASVTSVSSLSSRKHGKEDTQTDIDTVHLLFMNHLDVGYNGINPQTGFINNILNVYFHEYFPRAARLADELREDGYEERLIYTTHPWVVSLFVNCPSDLVLNGIKLQCPTETEMEVFTRAVKLGDITWHAGPMNMQPENMNELLFEMSLNISSDLDSYFGFSKLLKTRFRTLSQRDVPGMSQAVLPALVRKEIIAVSVGVNPDTSPPAVPPGVFLWKYQEFFAIAIWHPGGYPLNPGPSPSKPGGLSRKDCVTTNSLNHALCFAFRTDNRGPPFNITEILSNFAIVRAEFPGAYVQASTFNKFIQAILPITDSLPVYTKEIGDTWIEGVASDPRKMAEYRCISSTLTTCIAAGDCDARDARITDAIRFLIKPAEHTWGLPGVGDNFNWTNVAFQKAKSGGNYKNCTMAWVEQRQFNTLAIKALEDHPIVKQIQTNLDLLTPKEPQLMNYTEIPLVPEKSFSCNNGIELSIGSGGEITYLYDPFNKINWTDSINSMARFWYRTYNEEDFEPMVTEYNYSPGNPFGSGFHKINSTKYANPVSQFWESKVTALYQNKENTCDFLVKVTVTESDAHQLYGAPDRIWVNYKVLDSKTQNNPDIEVTFQWFDKTSTRLPEAMFYTFQPVPQTGMSWKISKIGHLIDPLNVGLNGSQHIHATDGAVFYTKGSTTEEGLRIVSVDVPLVSPYSVSDDNLPTPFPVPLTPIEQTEGMGFNFYNNIWDANYILWYPYLDGDENFKARFSISFLYAA